MFRRRHQDEQDNWLNELFRSGRAGAEFMLPWTVDTYVTAVTALKAQFSPGELKTVIEAHRDTSIDTAHLGVTHLLLQVMERCDRDGIHIPYGADPHKLEARCRQLDDTRAAVLILWASAFWSGQTCTAQAMEKYVSAR